MDTGTIGKGKRMKLIGGIARHPEKGLFYLNRQETIDFVKAELEGREGNIVIGAMEPRKAVEVLLKKKPCTVRELANLLDVKEPTIRAILYDLMADGKASDCEEGRVRESPREWRWIDGQD